MTIYSPSITKDGSFSTLVLNKLKETLLPRSEAPSFTIPAYAGTRTHKWDSPNYYAESVSLTNFREVVARGLRGDAVEIVCIGDSKTEGAGLSGAQSGFVGEWAYPAQLRRMLGASEGFIPANVNAGDKRWTVGNMARSAADRCALIPSPAADFALVKHAQVVTTEPHTGARVYAQSSAGGTLTVTVDGVASSWVVPAAIGWSERIITGLPNATHTIRVESTADFDMLGITPTYSTPRLRITRGGRSSSSAANWNATTADGLWASVVAGAPTDPDALIVNLGTNDPANVTALTNIYARAAALNIPVLCVSPGGLGGLSSYSTYDAAKDAIYDASDSHAFPLVDFESVIGDYATANGLGLMGDTVHENANGYALQAAAVARAISLT